MALHWLDRSWGTGQDIERRNTLVVSAYHNVQAMSSNNNFQRATKLLPSSGKAFD